jgi:hypothetical protein
VRFVFLNLRCADGMHIVARCRFLRALAPFWAGIRYPSLPVGPREVQGNSKPR